ncbi:unnamed protein product, partial [marine sediment metagenome]
MKDERKIIGDEAGTSSMLEGVVAIGISISLLTIFFISANNAYSIHERDDVDLAAKNTDIMEKLLNSP